MKKNISLFLILIFILNFVSLCSYSQTVLDGQVEFYDINKPNQNIFTGETEKLEAKDVIKMTVSQVMSSGYVEEGDEFFAQITADVEGKKGVILPVGTIAHGKIKEVGDAKRLGRNGWISLSFDYLITPDGREIPIEGQMSTKMHAAKSIAKIALEDTGYTLVGGLVGGFAALQLLGIEAAIASNGYTLAGGAAIGGAVGLGISLFRKGKDALISPGDEIKVKMITPIDLPVISEAALRVEELKYDGLEVKITNVKLENDPFGEKNTYNLSLIIKNDTDKSFSSFDMALMNEAKLVYYPSVFGENTILMTKIKPYDRISGKLAFAVDNPRNKHWLVFFDRKTRKPLAKISLDNAMRDHKLREKQKKQKK